MALLEIKDLSKVYQGPVPYEALKKIDLKVEEGEFVSIMGPSGSGKTTLLNLIATLDQPTSGNVFIKGRNPHELSKNELAEFRRKELGFVFQNFNLLPTLTVEENIMLPLTLDNQSVVAMKEKAYEVMEDLDILNLRQKRTYEISGGESQRVAIARALIHRPSLILADEPTGNLDSKAAGNVMHLLEKFNFERNVTTLMVTHDAVSASYSHRVVFIKDGKFFNEIYCGDDRELFYQKILDVLAHLGGTNHEFQATRLS
ncbi:ABC transporter ATP-binding protein [Vagococcus salmoninarum]|uniref:Bacitracin ABC transporter ATP-binding protein n=1 Tax=Vagococcus salmoninarum TaxID=2739 RepID=A0A429ZT32_9ENTE|nr:ABC transporter ATP-binding protein [Vagococcus salmoninarum]MBE9389811.1 ABC transporter ATP-binding protein [Vagococcus salmoninarum]RST96901.1 bacitracin ABC transporter ATP-binding protein [Vagococcus salmoninarum]